MPPWIGRSCIAIHIVSSGLLALMFTHVHTLGTFRQSASFTSISILFLGFVCVGFWLKLIRHWSTRLFWEWVAISAIFLGGWVIPATLVPGARGFFLAVLLMSVPFFFTHPLVRLSAFLISAAGAGIFLAAYIPIGPLWLLWVGLTLHDAWMHKGFAALEQALKEIERKRKLFTLMPEGAKEGVVVLSSHIALPAALITQAAERSTAHGLALLAALLIGAWYAMMRPVHERAATILPWAMIWMVGAEILLKIVQR